MKQIKLNRSTLLIAFFMLAAGLLIGWFAKPTAPSGTTQEGHQPENIESAPSIWTCSMHPQIRQPEPGKCPLCGMDLIPLDDNDSEESPMEIRMSPTAMQLANVQTMIVGYGVPNKEVRMTGKIQPDERRVFSQVSHFDGRVEQLNVNFTGETVKQGQKLASIYAPQLVTAQEELISAMKIRDMQPALFLAAKEKLKNWKLTDQQIENIAATGKVQEQFPIMADVSGIVLDKRVNLGDYVMRGMPLYTIADLSKVWVLFDVYENDMPWAKVGSTVSFTVQSIPGKSFNGKITFIDPVINPVSRVATARVEIPNPGRQLKPEMFVSGVIKTQLTTKKESLIAPRSAVMWTGERSVVYLKKTTDKGVHFLMQEVKLGPLTSEGYLINEGLVAGDEIAVNGTFSIDAAAQLAGKPSMMNPEGSAVKTGHQHSGGVQPANENIQQLEVSKQAKVALKHLFDRYFLLKDALVKDDMAAAQKHASQLKKLFETTNMDLFSGAAHKIWMDHSSTALDLLKKLIAAKNLDEERRQFKPLSEQMVRLAKAFGPLDTTMYVQHCPMADSNTGADWLSLEKQILNPYFGDKMLKCGAVTETIR